MLDLIRNIISSLLGLWHNLGWGLLASIITAISTLISSVYYFFIRLRLDLVGFKKEGKISYENNQKIVIDEIYAMVRKKGKGIVKNCIIKLELNGYKWEKKIHKGMEPISITTEYPLFLFSINGKYIGCDFKSVVNGYECGINGLLSDYMDKKFKFTIISENAADIVIEKKISQILKNCKI